MKRLYAPLAAAFLAAQPSAAQDIQGAQVVYEDAFCAATGQRATARVTFLLNPFSMDLAQGLHGAIDARKDVIRKRIDATLADPTPQNRARLDADLRGIFSAIVTEAGKTATAPAQVASGYRILYPQGPCTP